MHIYIYMLGNRSYNMIYISFFCRTIFKNWAFMYNVSIEIFHIVFFCPTINCITLNYGKSFIEKGSTYWRKYKIHDKFKLTNFFHQSNLKLTKHTCLQDQLKLILYKQLNSLNNEKFYFNIFCTCPTPISNNSASKI